MIKPISDMIAEGLQKFYTQFKSQRILKTKEEVTANTNPDNLPSALVVDELIDNLKSSFQDGVDTLYNGCVALGFTPTGKTPQDIINAINKMYAAASIPTNTRVQATCIVYRGSGGTQMSVTITGYAYIDNGKLKLKNVTQYPLSGDTNASGTNNHNMVTGPCTMNVI